MIHKELKKDKGDENMSTYSIDSVSSYFCIVQVPFISVQEFDYAGKAEFHWGWSNHRTKVFDVSNNFNNFYSINRRSSVKYRICTRRRRT